MSEREDGYKYFREAERIECINLRQCLSDLLLLKSQ